MATATQAGSPPGDDKDKIAIAMAILGMVIVIIIIVVRYMNRVQHVAAVNPVVQRIQQRREEELSRKEMRRTLLASLQVVRYSKKLPTNEQLGHKVQVSTRDSHSSRRQLQTSMNRGKIRVISTESRPATGVDNGKSETMANNFNTHDDTIRTTPDEDTLRGRDQPRSRDEPAVCSVCTEDFAERERVRILHCGHIYHQRCIDPWFLDFGSTCPLWLASLKP